MKSYIFKNPKLDFIELRYVEDIKDCVKMHIHEELTITAIKKGSLTLIFNETSITVKPNEIAIINSQIPHSATTNEKSKDGYTLEMVNHLHDRIKAFFRGKRNVMTHYLQGYLALFQYS